MVRKPAFMAATALFGSMAASASAVVVGQIDDFEDGTVQNWTVAALGASHPAPPQNIPDGGPTGAGDAYMRLTSVGGGGAGSRLAAMNLVQWGGNYVDAGVSRITMWVLNEGNTDLTLRLLFEDPGAGPPQNIAASTTGAFVAAGSGWQQVSFGTTAADLTALLGTVDAVLTNTTVLRIFHNPEVGFPPPVEVAMVGVDNIQAVPEPATLAVLGLGLAAIGRRRRK